MLLKSIVDTDFPAPVVAHPYVSKTPVLSDIDNPFVKTAQPSITPVPGWTGPVNLPPSAGIPINPNGMSLQTMNDLFTSVPAFGNTGIGGYYLNPTVDDSKIVSIIGTAQNLANSPVPSASQNGLAAPASIVAGQPEIQTQTAGSGIFSTVLGVLGNVLGQVLSGPAGGVASQGGSSVTPVGGGSVLSTPTNNPSPATQPGQGGAMNLSGLLLPVGIGLIVLKLIKII